MSDNAGWRGPRIAEIAKRAGVGSATVDRVLNNRGGVRGNTRDKVIAVLDQLQIPLRSFSVPARKIGVISEAGRGFNRALKAAVERVDARMDNVDITFDGITSSDFDAIRFGQQIERFARGVEGLMVVAREDMTVNRALRSVAAKKPIVCLTTDLPNSQRSAYVGNDQVSAGSTAAHLMGKFLPTRPSDVLLVISAPYRVQQEREAGFRQVLRTSFPHLRIVERAQSNDDSIVSYEYLMSYLKKHEAPGGIYNVAGGSPGIGRAIREAGLRERVLFIGHELNDATREMLEDGVMDVVIGHDVEREVVMAASYLAAALAGQEAPIPLPSSVLIHMRYNSMCFLVFDVFYIKW